MSRLARGAEGDLCGTHPADVRPVDVRGDGEEPGRKCRLVPPAGEGAVGLQEGVLGHFLGSSAIPAEPVGQVHQRALPPIDDATEGLDIPGQYTADIRAVLLCGSFAHSLTPSDAETRGRVALSPVGDEKTQPISPGPRPTP